MKTVTARIITSLGLISLLAGCTSPDGRPDYTGSGALIGGLSGAAIGAAADRRAPGVGALIGGAAGLIAGGLVGHSMDQQAEAQQSLPPPTYYPPTTVVPPTVAEIKAMAKAGMSDEVIIGQINSTHAVYNLDATKKLDPSLFKIDFTNYGPHPG